MSLAEIVEIDYSKLDDADFVAINAFENELKDEARPEDPKTPLERTIAQVKNLPDFLSFREFWIRDSERLIAVAYAWWRKTEENRHLAWADVSVLADARGRGIGKRLLRHLVDVVKADGRTLMSGSTVDRLPSGEAFCRRIGAEVGQEVHTNRLLIADVDTGLVRRWMEEGPVRAPGYSLVAVDGPLPDDIAQNAVDAIDIMNTAPRDDLDWEDFTLTVEHMREIEKAGLAEGTERWFVFARHDDSGRFVGLTEMFWNPASPKVVNQGDTGVHPDHRGHAIGKWLKATTLERVMRERPQVDQIRTGNADSNDAMLGINHALGFTPYIAHLNWQVSVERVEEYLSER
jgi:mycothiol synthase